MPDFDPVKRPAHYNLHPSGVECGTIAEAFNFNLGNVIKYVWRAGLKNENPLQDLEKAAEYIQREIDRVKSKESKFDQVIECQRKYQEQCQHPAITEIIGSPYQEASKTCDICGKTM